MTRPWSRLTLLHQYTLLSAVIAVVLAFFLSITLVWELEWFFIRDQAKIAYELIAKDIWPEFSPQDLVGTLSRERRVFLDNLFRAQGISDQVLRIRIWRSDGRLLYSNVPEVPAPTLSGVDLTKPGGFEGYVMRKGFPELTPYRIGPFPNSIRLLRPPPERFAFFVPVKKSQQTVAAFEIFTDLSALRGHLNDIRRKVYVSVPIGIGAFYVLVFLIVHRGSNLIDQQKAQLRRDHVGTLESLATAIDARDSYTGHHSSTVSELAVQVAQALKLPPQIVEDARESARLHDVGKIGMPDAILQKPSPLNPDELLVMRNHAERGFEILRGAPLSDRVKVAVRHSHERWDGNGYPGGLSGEDIPLLSRIVAVVDAYDAMTDDRPYRKGMPIQVALQRLERDAGTQFDPRIVEVFILLIRKITAIGAPDSRSAARLS